MQRKQVVTQSKSYGDLAVDGLLRGLAAGLIMLVFLLAAGMLAGTAPVDCAGPLWAAGQHHGGDRAARAPGGVGGVGAGVGGAVWRSTAPAAAAGLAAWHRLRAGALCRGGALRGERDRAGEFAPWALLAAHMAYGVTLGTVERTIQDR